MQLPDVNINTDTQSTNTERASSRLVHAYDASISTRTYAVTVSPQFPTPSWVTMRVVLDTFVCLSADKKNPSISLVLVVVFSRFTCTTYRRKHKHRRKDFPFSYACAFHVISRFTRTFSCAYACVVRVKQPLFRSNSLVLYILQTSWLEISCFLCEIIDGKQPGESRKFSRVCEGHEAWRIVERESTGLS